jgi:hypothetical protein
MRSASVAGVAIDPDHGDRPKSAPGMTFVANLRDCSKINKPIDELVAIGAMAGTCYHHKMSDWLARAVAVNSRTHET